MNNTALGCMSVGWLLIILGTIISIFCGANGMSEVFTIIGVIFSIVFGTLLIGIGEIIHLISKMVNKDNQLGVNIVKEQVK